MSDSVEVKVHKKKSKMASMSLKSWVVLLLVVLSLGAAFYFWQDARDARSQTPEAQAAQNAEESARVISKLDEILLTESEDEPTVARIENPQVLKDANADFYKNAAEGDYLVLYPQRAIIYRETENRIINLAPIINTSQLQTGANTTPAPADDTTDEAQ